MVFHFRFYTYLTLDSNTPFKYFYLVYEAEILRSTRATMMLPSFKETLKILINRMMKEGGKINRL